MFPTGPLSYSCAMKFPTKSSWYSQGQYQGMQCFQTNNYYSFLNIQNRIDQMDKSRFFDSAVGNTSTVMTHQRLVNKRTGNDKEGEGGKDTVKGHQKKASGIGM